MHCATLPATPPTTAASRRLEARRLAEADDLVLVELVVGGSTRAFDEIVRRHRPGLMRRAVRRLHDPSDAEECVQDAFVRAYRALGSFGARGQLGAWLGRICDRCCQDRLRGARRREERVARAVAGLPADDTIAVRRTAPDDRGARVAAPDLTAVTEMADALDRLDDEQRAAVVLLDLYGMSSLAAAAAIGTPASTLRSRHATGRAKLAILLAA